MAGLGCKEVWLDAWEFYHVFLSVVECAKFVVFLQKRTVVHVEETEVPCSYSSASFVHVNIAFYFVQPLEGFSDQNVFFEEDASLFIQYMEHYEPSFDVFEVVLEIAFGLFRHSILQQF